MHVTHTCNIHVTHNTFYMHVRHAACMSHVSHARHMHATHMLHACCMQGVRSSSEATRRCYLNTLKHVMKTLAGRRLVPQRKVFYDVTTSLFVHMVGLWNTHLQGGVAQLRGGEEEGALKNMDMAHVCLKSGCGGQGASVATHPNL